jgi:hypothetical protein
MVRLAAQGLAVKAIMAVCQAVLSTRAVAVAVLVRRVAKDTAPLVAQAAQALPTRSQAQASPTQAAEAAAGQAVAVLAVAEAAAQAAFRRVRQVHPTQAAAAEVNTVQAS